MTRTMNRTSLMLVAALATLNLQPAHAWVRGGGVATPRGVYLHGASGSCAGGACARSGSTTGPWGRSVSSTGSITRTAPGQVQSSGTFTGWRGNTWQHSGQTSCAGGTCTRTGSVSGPQGGSASSVTTVTATPPAP